MLTVAAQLKFFFFHPVRRGPGAAELQAAGAKFRLAGARLADSRRERTQKTSKEPHTSPSPLARHLVANQELVQYTERRIVPRLRPVGTICWVHSVRQAVGF